MPPQTVRAVLGNRTQGFFCTLRRHSTKLSHIPVQLYHSSGGGGGWEKFRAKHLILTLKAVLGIPRSPRTRFLSFVGLGSLP